MTVKGFQKERQCTQGPWGKMVGTSVVILKARRAEKKNMYRASRSRGQKLGRALLSIRPLRTLMNFTLGAKESYYNILSQRVAW